VCGKNVGWCFDRCCNRGLSPFVAVSEKGGGDVTLPEADLRGSDRVLSWPRFLSDDLVWASGAADVVAAGRLMTTMSLSSTCM
jgi:hypothetical protein